ncbi:MAG: nucleoside hydrolase [Prevotellaceae bacterium]|nr:nucleoside hydrolase [Prevotellaceae bacterium]
MRKYILLAILLFCSLPMLRLSAQTTTKPLPKVKVIIDNDFCGDPDGLFQLTHQLLCKSCDIRAIVGGHLAKNAGFTNRTDQATESCEKANEILELLGMKGKVKVVPGAESGLTSTTTPIESEGARTIVAEARQCTPEKPLYILCGASLTNVACAHLMDPSIDDKVIVVWIGGQEYTGIGSYPPPGYSKVEYNLNLSIPAGQVVFNQSKMRIWQVPRDVYRQCLYGLDEVKTKIAPYGKIGKYLLEQLQNTVNVCEKYGIPMGECYILGDSPLVLLTALQSGFEADPSSSQYQYVSCPAINADGSYGLNHQGRMIRVYTHIDSRLMFGDLEAKMQLLGK